MKKIIDNPAIDIIPVKKLVLKKVEIEVDEASIKEWDDGFGGFDFEFDVPPELDADRKDYADTVVKITQDARRLYINEATGDGETHTDGDEYIATAEWDEIHEEIPAWWDGIAQVLGAEGYKDFVKEIINYGAKCRSDGITLRDKQKIEWESLGYDSSQSPIAPKELSPQEFVAKYKPELVDGKIKVQMKDKHYLIKEGVKKYVAAHRAEIMELI